MKCNDFEIILVDLARDRLIEAAARDQGLAHASACSRCCSRLEYERSVVAALTMLAESQSGCAAPAHVELNLIAAFRENNWNAAPVHRARPASRRPLTWAAAAAIVIMAIAALAWFQSRPIDRPVPAAGNSAQAQAPEPVSNEPSGSRKATDASGKQAAVHPTHKRSLVHTASNGEATRESLIADKGNSAQGDSEVTTDFMPLSFTENVAGDSLQLVRVALPRSALASFGLPINTERAGQPIKADVVVGNDGVARAIRFVY